MNTALPSEASLTLTRVQEGASQRLLVGQALAAALLCGRRVGAGSAGRVCSVPFTRSPWSRSVRRMPGAAPTRLVRDDHSRIRLSSGNSHSSSDYINASPIHSNYKVPPLTLMTAISGSVDGQCRLHRVPGPRSPAQSLRFPLQSHTSADKSLCGGPALGAFPLFSAPASPGLSVHSILASGLWFAQFQMDHDPRKPAYIATQGPLPATVADFWQMVWESGCVVIVMLTPLSENGVRQCYHYWPDEGSNLYHIYEHIWCEDFLVRSFYLKNLRTSETRTVSQFHFLSWHDQAVPASTRSLLDFRSDGAGRSGTYVLIDMVLNKMAKGAKEIDIAATLEHLRDQRPGMVQTKEQFEFALTAVAEEVNAILQAFPQDPFAQSGPRIEVPPSDHKGWGVEICPEAGQAGLGAEPGAFRVHTGGGGSESVMPPSWLPPPASAPPDVHTSMVPSSTGKSNHFSRQQIPAASFCGCSHDNGVFPWSLQETLASP
ncbi:hypothetical protein CB1_000880003 [Camelus ferus]|nr:hypothetical protein CB1_000880003 [Camelus ferus]